MVDLVNPGLLGSATSFKKEYEIPITRSRQPEALKKVVEDGNMRAEELSQLTSMFILRRTNDVLASYLPPKTDLVVFCHPTKLQREAYLRLLESSALRRAMEFGDMSTHLSLITTLRKLCNSPGLIMSATGDGAATDATLREEFGPLLDTCLKGKSSSGKLLVLDRLLCLLREKTKEKVVVVSNYTQTLDLLETLLKTRNMSFVRMDGSTPNAKRQAIVDQFNRTDSAASFVFLLSSKSGGVGLNLIGASRMILYDVDWNPANDSQAMARIHRDGQKREVFIYRFLTIGCMDEKIFQRQLTKQGYFIHISR